MAAFKLWLSPAELGRIMPDLRTLPGGYAVPGARGAVRQWRFFIHSRELLFQWERGRGFSVEAAVDPLVEGGHA